jgi:hypothetical protein
MAEEEVHHQLVLLQRSEPRVDVVARVLEQLPPGPAQHRRAASDYHPAGRAPAVHEPE